MIVIFYTNQSVDFFNRQSLTFLFAKNNSGKSACCTRPPGRVRIETAETRNTRSRIVLALAGPDQIAVTNTFTKILKPMKGKPTLDEETGLTRGMINTIGFREYVQWQGNVEIAFAPGATNVQQQLDAQPAQTALDWPQWLTMITYFGKRGGFVQAIASEPTATLPERFTPLDQVTDSFLLNGALQLMDDCGPETTFEQVDIYSGKALRLGKDRLLRPIILPYRVERSSRGYTLYRRVE
jgi:hypothetical protein